LLIAFKISLVIENNQINPIRTPILGDNLRIVIIINVSNIQSGCPYNILIGLGRENRQKV